MNSEVMVVALFGMFVLGVIGLVALGQGRAFRWVFSGGNQEVEAGLKVEIDGAQGAASAARDADSCPAALPAAGELHPPPRPPAGVMWRGQSR